MIRRVWLLAVLLGTAGSGQEVPRAVPVPDVPVVPPQPRPADRTISRSGQFRVSGADGLVRGSVGVMADAAKDELLALTGEKDAWKVPISIFLHGKQGDPLPPRSVAMRRVLTDTGCELFVDVHLSHGIELESFKHTITSALLYERALRGPARPDERLMVPPWLVEGLREATAWGLKRGDRRLYEALFKHGGLYKLEELFAMDEAAFEDLDGAMRAAFRGSSGALVMALIEQPQGKEGFGAFLTEVPAFQGELPTLLRRHFPDLNLSETSLAKWLSLKLADMVTPTTTDVLGVAETDAALTQALQLNFRDADGSLQRRPIEDWEQLAELKAHERAGAVRQAQDSLVRLSYRCFPSYRPLLAEYQIALGEISRGKTRKTAAQLAALAKTRGEMMTKNARASDYLDWFEITRARDTSGEFEDYRRLKARLQDNPRTRDDHISIYLDRMNKIFARKGDPSPPPPGLEPILPMLSGEPETLPPLPENLPQHLPIDQRPVIIPRDPAGDVPIDLPKP